MCRGYSACVPARLGLDSTVVICVETEDHNNWLRTSACCVWESQASLRKDILASFGSLDILPLSAFDFDLHFIGVCSVYASFLRVK